MKPLACAFLALSFVAASAHRVVAQTFDTTRAIHEVKCQRYLFSNRCVTIETDRIHSTFMRAQVGYYVFGRTWAGASHCTRLDATETKCLRSISISTDPEWNRLVWGQAGTFLRLVGTGGTSTDGPGHFLGPLGVDVTRREGEWHVAFVADSRNNRIAVLALGYDCKCAKWLGTLDASESGTLLKDPHDVAWDPAETWTFADDRVFIADTDNHRVVVYHVSLDPVGGTMTKTYLGSFGSSGPGPNQFSRPQGLTVRSIGVQQVGGGWSYLYADVYVSDTDNRRVSLWHYDGSNSTTPGTPSAAAQSAPIASSEFVGITRDYYGDVIVADRARDALVKYSRDQLALLKTYGGTSSWSTGNFNDPTDVAVIYNYWQDASGALIREALPYVQSVEQWTATTGGQLHHLGVDAEELAVATGQCEATFTFLFTAYGDYTLKVKNSGGGVVASWVRTGVGSGRKSEYWNSQGQPAGTYSYVVEHRSAYGDEAQSRTSTGPSFNQNCFTVTASAPSTVTQGGSYDLLGSSTHAADSWKWERDDGFGYSLWANAQNSSFYVPDDPGANYTINWTLSARRTTDGIWASGMASTHVDICMPGPGVECPLAPAPSPPRIAGSGILRQGAQAQTRRERRNNHIGSGAWIGGRKGARPAVLQLYGLTQGTWANALGGDPETVQEAKDAGTGMTGRAVFVRRPLAAGGEAYRVRFFAATTGLSDVFLGFALDPELGRSAGDEVLGLDTETGLVWVTDPDSGVIGYVVTDVPRGGRVTVRQFSTRRDAWRPDPVSDSAAYAELSAGNHALTGKPGDVRLLLAIGPVTARPRITDVGLLVLRAPSVEALRELAAEAPRSILGLFTDDTAPAAATTAITGFHFTQAPPDPMAPEGVNVISPALAPGLSVPADSTVIPGSDRARLRDAVRRFGITALAFAVPDGAQAPVKIRLYDPAGRLVRMLVNDTYSSGAYRVQWDLKDQRGSRVAPGIYIAIMEAQGFRGMTRLVVVP